MKCKPGTILLLVGQYVYALPNKGKVKATKLNDIYYELVSIDKYNTETDSILSIRSKSGELFTTFGEQSDISGFSAVGLKNIAFKIQDGTIWCTTTDRMIDNVRPQQNELIVAPYSFYGASRIVNVDWLTKNAVQSVWGGIELKN